MALAHGSTIIGSMDTYGLIFGHIFPVAKRQQVFFFGFVAILGICIY